MKAGFDAATLAAWLPNFPSTAGPAWLQRQRRQAWERLQQEAGPDVAQEDWRYTNPQEIGRAHV
jgi:hypothetical protein